MPSASVGELNSLYEPIHGSFPEATGKNSANPLNRTACYILKKKDSNQILRKFRGFVCPATNDYLQKKNGYYYSKKSNFLIEPKAQLFISPDDYYNNKIRNEDSLELDLTSSNLFNHDRYSGNDRRESGTILNYGILLKKIKSL